MLSRRQLRAIRELVAKYEALSPAKRRAHQETEVRTNFIDPLFEALGWPMDDREHVERETTGIEGKRPDYIFNIAGVPRFFLEAKPFRDDIYDQEETRKAITKAYNKGVPWVGIINFERFVLYDAQEELTEAQPRRVLDLGYLDYLDTQAEAGIHLLTREAVQSHSLEEFAQRIGARRRVVPIEKRLYDSMRGWREDLFNALFQVKQWKTEEEFRQGDEAIQRLIDRLIFLRNCEDRDIGGTDLRGLRNRIRSRDRAVRVTESVLRLFARAASTYDSEIFQTDAVIDVLLHGMGTVLDETLANIIEGLYSVPRSYSEYDFSQMEPDVLGEVYEQYLGYVPQRVRKLAAQPPLPGMPADEITIEAKRQRRKERGIYYTPRWVVQYIVQQTLGRFLQENGERPDAIDNLTILDPACGSGSFLIRAYETLLEHHAEQMGGDIGHLDTHTRERILRRNIFGVDLDPQAVEIARLNLLIRMVRQQERLPELKDNIEHGNSLIEGDKAALHPYFGDAWEEKQPFNWGQRFPDVMERGGFDIIIGNPPYVRIQTLPRDEAAYYRAKYHSAFGSFDIYVVFIEAALQLLNQGGRLGFITGGKFLKSEYGKKLCDLLRKKATVEEIVDVSALRVFSGATTYPVILILQKGATAKKIITTTVPPDEFQPTADHISRRRQQQGYEVDQQALQARIWPPPHGRNKDLLDKLQETGAPLETAAPHIFQGLVTSADRVYTLLYRSEAPDKKVIVHSTATGADHPIERGVLKALVDGKAVGRYSVWPGVKLLLFPYDVSEEPGRLLTEEQLQSLFPSAWEYLQLNRKALQDREHGKMKHDRWYGYVYPKNLTLHAQRKLIVPRLVYHLEVTYDARGQYYLDNVDVGGIILQDASEENYLYTLATLNSKLVDFFFRQRSVPFRGEYRSANRQFLAPIPLKSVQSVTEVSFRNQITISASRMLDLHQRLAAKGDIRDSEREQIDHDIEAADREIDNLVYDLYGLTQKERALVESEIRR